MIRATGRYHQQTLKLDDPVALEDGARVVIEITPADAMEADVEWSDIAMERLEAEWDNPTDAIYDDWRTLYGVPAG